MCLLCSCHPSLRLLDDDQGLSPVNGRLLPRPRSGSGMVCLRIHDRRAAASHPPEHPSMHSSRHKNRWTCQVSALQCIYLPAEHSQRTEDGDDDEDDEEAGGGAELPHLGLGVGVRRTPGEVEVRRVGRLHATTVRQATSIR